MPCRTSLSGAVCTSFPSRLWHIPGLPQCFRDDEYPAGAQSLTEGGRGADGEWKQSLGPGVLGPMTRHGLWGGRSGRTEVKVLWLQTKGSTENLATASLASHLFILKFNFPPTWPM